MRMTQEAALYSDVMTGVRLRLKDDSVQIVQGDDIIIISPDEFPSFLKLAQKWWDTCEVPDPH